jgi:hypothetical protein
MSGATTAYLTMQGAGAVGQAYGAYSSAQGSKSAMQSQANIANTMAEIAEINAQGANFSAEQTLLSGQRREQNVRLKGAQLKSSQRASMAANGIDLGSQTPVNILTSTDLMVDEDARAVALDSLRAAWGYRTQSTNYVNEAISKRAQANGLNTTANAINPFLSGASSLLSSAGSVATNWYMMNKLGMFGDGSGNEKIWGSSLNEWKNSGWGFVKK